MKKSIAIVLLMVLAGFSICIGIQLSYLGRPEHRSLETVQEWLTGGNGSTIGQVLGWESHSAGFDDTTDWIEFTTDQAGVEKIIRSRDFSPHPEHSHPEPFRKLLKARGWDEPAIQYEADDLMRGGSVIHLAYRTRDKIIQVLIHGVQQ